jgi:nucleoid-associated protein YgaU
VSITGKPAGGYGVGNIMATPVKALLFLGGASAAALGTAYVAGAFDPAPSAPPAAIAQPVTPVDGAAAPAQAPAEAQAESKPAEQQVASAPAQPEQPAAAVETPAPIAPVFDVLRVEPDGSMVIAGKAMGGSTVDALAGSKLLGSSKTTPEGDFAIVLDVPLEPGDYQIVLRSTGPGTIVVNSVETAVVSVPATPEGQVLALVQQPGAPSKLITATPAVPELPAASAEIVAQPPIAAPSDQPAASPPPPTVAAVKVDAVEIDGRKVFVAGSAPQKRLCAFTLARFCWETPKPRRKGVSD